MSYMNSETPGIQAANKQQQKHEGWTTHRVIDWKINNDKVAQSMQNKPTGRALATDDYVKREKNQDAEQHLDKDVIDFAFKRWFEK